MIALFADAAGDADRLKQLGLGGAFAIVIVGMVLTFLSKRKDQPQPPRNGNGVRSGERPVEYWHGVFSEIIQKCIDDRLRADIQAIRDDQKRIIIGQERIDAKLDALLKRRRTR